MKVTRPVLALSVSRRAMLKTLATAGLLAALPRRSHAQSASRPEWQAAVLRYLATLSRPDHGYAWGDQAQSHLTPTFAVIGSHRLLRQAPPDKSALAEYVRTHHPRELKKLEQERRSFEFQQVQALAWLGDSAADFRVRIATMTRPLPYLKQYERHGYPVFQSELGIVHCHALLGLPLDSLSPAFPDYIVARRRANGSFNNTPAPDGGDGHVMNTLWGLQALRLLGLPDGRSTDLIAWLRACQRPNSGFTYQPQPAFGGVDDVAYTRAAVRALKLLGAAPAHRDTCLAYLHSLANADGGFSDRPGWLSNPLATYYALDALDALNALDSLAGIRRRAPRQRIALPSDLNVYSIQIEAHGQGSPAEAVELARALRIDLWGAKNAKPAWMVRAQAIAAAQKVPVQFFPANEEYGTWVDIPGLGTYSHTSDVVAPPKGDFGASLAGQGAVSWADFRARRLGPLLNGGGRLVWQFGENEELVRLFLDDSVERGGFAAISTFHFGNPDFTNTEPFLHRWRGQIPYIGLQDAHGPEPWWSADMTVGFRTVFLAPAPTWAGWLNALKKNWVVAIRRDAISRGQTWMHSGSPEVLAFVQARELDWRWWDNPAIARPLVSVVPVRPTDEFEVARPEQGITLRVRCAWENAPHGLLRKPISELIRLTVDGGDVEPTLVAKKRPNGLLDEHYHHIHLANLTPGKHTATAVVRVLATNAESSRSVEFSV